MDLWPIALSNRGRILGSCGGTCRGDQLDVLRPSQLQAFQATPSLPLPSDRFSTQLARGNFERLAYNKGSDIFVDFIFCVVDFFCSIINPLNRLADPPLRAAGPFGCLFNPPCRFFDPLCCLVDSLCCAVGPRSRFFDLPGILVNALLYRCLSKESEWSYDNVGTVYLVICDGISQILDKPVQPVGMVVVLQELRKPMLLGQWSELSNDPNQLPANHRCDQIC